MTEITRIAAAAAAVREALSKFDGIDEMDMALVVQVSVEAEVARTIENVITDVSKRYGVPIKIDWR